MARFIVNSTFSTKDHFIISGNILSGTIDKEMSLYYPHNDGFVKIPIKHTNFIDRKGLFVAEIALFITPDPTYNDMELKGGIFDIKD